MTVTWLLFVAVFACFVVCTLGSSSVLTHTGILNDGECLSSASNRAHACLKGSQLVVHNGLTPDKQGKVLWSSPKMKGKWKGGFFGAITSGAFTIYSGQPGPAQCSAEEGESCPNPAYVWSTPSSSEGVCYLSINDEGTLALYDNGWFTDTLLWSTNEAEEEAVKPLSPTVTDHATGITFPRTKTFANGKELLCLGAGVRAKNLGVVNVNVYSVALYVDMRSAAKSLAAFKGLTSHTLAGNDKFYETLLSGGYSRYMHLIFARGVGAEKVVDAFTSVQGVAPEVLESFSAMLLDAIGGTVNKGDTITLGWEANKLVVLFSEKLVGEVNDATLPKAVFELYLGKKPVSLPAKKAFADAVPALLKAV